MKKKGRFRHLLALIPCVLIICVVLFLYFSGKHHLLNFDIIQAKHATWQAYVHQHPFLAALIFISVYTVSVTLVIPDSTFLCLIAGFLFPFPLALLYAIFSETLGATFFFLASQSAFKEVVGPKHFSFLTRARSAFHTHEVSYLLFLRFSHLMPFWIINLAAGVFRVKLKTFVWTTLIGVIPLTYVFVLSGAGLSKMIETNTHFSIASIFNTQVKIALVALGLLALVPILFKKRKA